MKDVVIVGALRTPIGCFRGALAGHSAVELGSLVVKALIERTGVSAYAVDEVILGQVLTAASDVYKRQGVDCRGRAESGKAIGY